MLRHDVGWAVDFGEGHGAVFQMNGTCRSGASRNSLCVVIKTRRVTATGDRGWIPFGESPNSGRHQMQVDRLPRLVWIVDGGEPFAIHSFADAGVVFSDMYRLGHARCRGTALLRVLGRLKECSLRKAV